MSDPRMKPGFIITASVIVLLLVISVFGLTSLNLPFIRPSGSSEIILLFALSTIIFLSLLIFGFILFRSLLKLYMERRANRLGSKFKTKLVFGALCLSVVPVFFLFLFSYSLLNRTLDKWFSRPFETISRDAREVVDELRGFARSQAASDAELLALELQSSASNWKAAVVAMQVKFASPSPPRDLDYVAVEDSQGKVLYTQSFQPGIEELSPVLSRPSTLPDAGASSRILDLNGGSYALARAPLRVGNQSGALLVARRLPPKISASAARLNQESVLYGALSQERKSLRKIYLSILLLMTVLILFIATWFALFLSRQITVPIQALAEATHEVSRGNLEYRVRAFAADELGILVRSFNEMTEQLASGRNERELSRTHLEQINTELDQRRQFTEAILESIPTGVISVSKTGAILGSNTAARRLFGRDPSELGHLSSLFSREDLRELTYLLKRAARMGQASRHLEIKLNDRTLNLAITVSALPGEPPGSASRQPGSSWYVLVMEDMSDLLQAQKAVAWREVAQRVAHEIKNPLTPIVLSSERIRLWLERQRGSPGESPELNRVVGESCALIRQEVEHLQRLVNEFAEFARFPQARPAPANLNQIIESALNLFNGRLDGIRIRTRLAPDLPAVQVDPEQFRRVFVNLIDNAAEAMDQALVKELVLTTRTDPQREVVEAEVSDTGCGVTTEDKEKLFLPYFSTKDRGTGLGLAIVSRIVSEHNGSIRFEENQPVGTRFIIELPILTS